MGRIGDGIKNTQRDSCKAGNRIMVERTLQYGIGYGGLGGNRGQFNTGTKEKENNRETDWRTTDSNPRYKKKL